jgi:hypothetical protein
MPVNFFKRRNILKSANALDLIPVLLVKYNLVDKNQIKLIVPRFQNKLLKRFIIGKKLKPEFNVTLDEIGSSVCLAMNSQKNIEKIITEVKKNFEPDGSALNDFENRTIAFIARLYQEGFITFNQLM